MVNEAVGPILSTVRKQEARECSAHFPLFSQSGFPAHETVHFKGVFSHPQLGQATESLTDMLRALSPR